MLCLRIIQQISFFLLLSLNIGCENDSITTAADNADLNSQIDSSLQQIITQKIFEKTNAIRTSRGLSELAQNDDMDKLAQLHSNNMVEYNFELTSPVIKCFFLFLKFSVHFLHKP